ncbi:MAG: hypothetical protein D6797_08160 [Bdellovibrio sp.]|nr:MAG: hypothetical protein D6797_08160 [Bdellovibrio sp.]
MKWISFLLTCLFVSVSVSVSLAQEVVDFSIHQEFVNTRALGMGNAFTAIADDYSAIFYNPAALARRKDGQFHLFLKGGGDTSYPSFVSDLTNASNSNNVQAVFDLIEANYGNQYNARLSLGGVWVRPHWGIAVIPVDFSSDIGMHQFVGPQVNVNVRQDTTISYSYARDVKWLGEGHHLSVGITGKVINRIHFSDSVDAGTLASNSNFFDLKRATEGMTLDFDLGALYTPPIPEKGFLKWFQYVKPTFAFVIRNVGDYGYPVNLNLISENSDKPPRLQRRIDLGSVWDLPDFWVFDPHFSFDIRDILHENWDVKKGLHMGAEFFWKMASWWKGYWSAGINQGYWTLGVGAKLALFQIDLATWGEEVSTLSAPKESRRVMLELSLDF